MNYKHPNAIQIQVLDEIKPRLGYVTPEGEEVILLTWEILNKWYIKRPQDAYKEVKKQSSKRDKK